MLTNKLDMDVQIHTQEINKPSDSSLILVPLKSKSLNVNQLVLKLDYLSINLQPKDIDEVGQRIFNEWETIFSLYPIERAFADILETGVLEINITFDATNIFSNTQLRNITKTISEILDSEIARILKISKENKMSSDEQARKDEKLIKENNLMSERRADLDLRERFNYLKEENNELKSALQQSKYDEFSQKEKIENLRLEIERQQRSLVDLQDNKHSEQINSRQKIQESLEDTSNRLRQNQQELLNKQREVQRLQSIVVENERYVNSLQADYDQLRETSNYQIEKTLEENDNLKAELIEYKNYDLENKQSMQLMQSEFKQLITESENVHEELKQKLQRMQYENDELRQIIKENQTFEEKTHQDLIETTKLLNQTSKRVKELEVERDTAYKNLENQIKTSATEKEELTAAYKASRELEISKNEELLELRQHVVSLEQKLQQADFDKKRQESNWQNRLVTEEREKERIIQQITSDKEQFIHNKEQEVQRLSERLAQQKELVDKLMANQPDAQAAWQENNASLESDYEAIYQKSKELELEVAKLLEANNILTAKLAVYEEKSISTNKNKVSDVTDLNGLEEKVEKELTVPQTNHKVVTEELEEDDVYYGYEDEDYDYDYDYEDYDDDYEYHEVDDLISYNPEEVEEDIDDLLDNKDEEGKSKISKKDFSVYELYLDNLPELVKQADGQDFQKFVEPKMKKFKKFKKEFEEDVKSPSLFSRKYKLETGLFNQMKAYVLMSRHLSILLDIEVAETEDDYDYDYEDDYDYDYDYEDDYDYDYDYDE